MNSHDILRILSRRYGIHDVPAHVADDEDKLRAYMLGASSADVSHATPNRNHYSRRSQPEWAECWTWGWNARRKAMGETV